jgi:hypothetical protein
MFLVVPPKDKFARIGKQEINVFPKGVENQYNIGFSPSGVEGRYIQTNNISTFKT